MDVKKLPSKRLFWSQNNLLLHCMVISHIITRNTYEQFRQCLHVANAPENITNHFSPTYDKLHKVRWMLNEMYNRFKSMWTSNQQLTMDESMVMHKGQYCPIR
jgi:hypothetical protein